MSGVYRLGDLASGSKIVRGAAVKFRRENGHKKKAFDSVRRGGFEVSGGGSL